MTRDSKNDQGRSKWKRQTIGLKKEDALNRAKWRKTHFRPKPQVFVTRLYSASLALVILFRLRLKRILVLNGLVGDTTEMQKFR